MARPLFRILAGAAVLAGEVPAAPRPAPPRRVVSLNLCADQILLALADRSQIAGLTRNAADPEMSAVAGQTRGLRILGRPSEQIVAIAPDLIVGMPVPRGTASATLDLKMANDFADIETSLLEAGRALGHADRGAALVARMRRDLASIPKTGHGRVAAYYQRRGFLTGTGTLVDDMMKRAGLVNLAAKLGKSSLSQVSLEEMVAAHPDFLIVESATDRVADQGTEMLHHPALAGIPRIHVPEAWTVCGSPAYVEAVRSMAKQIAAHDERG